MLADFLMDVLLLHQGRNVDETAIIMHSLKLSGETEIQDWESFLFAHVQPGDYVFPHDAGEIMTQGLSRRLRMIETLHPALVNDQFNMELSRRHGAIFLAAQNCIAKFGKEADQFLRHW